MCWLLCLGVLGVGGAVVGGLFGPCLFGLVASQLHFLLAVWFLPGKRIREEIEKGVPPKSKGTLIVEFSIENIQVVQRRAAKTGSTGKEKERGKGTKNGREQKTVGPVSPFAASCR